MRLYVVQNFSTDDQYHFATKPQTPEAPILFSQSIDHAHIFNENELIEATLTAVMLNSQSDCEKFPRPWYIARLCFEIIVPLTPFHCSETFFNWWVQDANFEDYKDLFALQHRMIDIANQKPNHHPIYRSALDYFRGLDELKAKHEQESNLTKANPTRE